MSRQRWLRRDEALVLDLLAQHADRWGTGATGGELIEASGGHLRGGVDYVLLHRMEEEGWIIGRPEERPLFPAYPRYRYELTELGFQAQALYPRKKRGNYGALLTLLALILGLAWLAGWSLVHLVAWWRG